MHFLEDNHYEAGRQLYESYQVVVSLYAIFVCVQAMRFVSVQRSLGVLVLMLQQMVVDVGVFLVLFAIVTLGFTVTLVGLQRQGSLDLTNQADEPIPYNMDNANSALFAPFWATFGGFDQSTYDAKFGVIM